MKRNLEIFGLLTDEKTTTTLPVLSSAIACFSGMADRTDINLLSSAKEEAAH